MATEFPTTGGCDVGPRISKSIGDLLPEIRERDGSPIHTLELPDGMKLDRGSYEVLLRYVLVDVVAA